MPFGSLLPKEVLFFDYFEQHARKCVEAAGLLRDISRDPARASELAKQIKDVEHEGDKITHETVEKLHKTFITPIDRDEIHRLITRLDDILDFINAASQRIAIYEIDEFTDEARELCDVLVNVTEQVEKAVTGLRSLENPTHLFKLCVEINRLENEGDAALRSGMARLFKERADKPVEIIKWKEIYENLEQATDSAEDVANTIEGIVLEHA